MIRRYAYLLTTVLVAMLLVGCDVHQWPERITEPDPDPEVPPTPGTPPAKVLLHLQYLTDFYVWEHRYDPVTGAIEEVDPSLRVFPDYPGTSSKYNQLAPTGQVRVYVKVFPASSLLQCVAEETFIHDIDGTYDSDLELELPGYGTYDIVVWSDLLESSQAAPFYDPSSFSQVHLIPDNYQGNTDYRDGFRGQLRVDVASETVDRQVVYMKRPMGKFELVTIDLAEFLERETANRNLSARASAEEYRVVISFPMYYPSSYSAMDDRLEDVSTGVAFQTSMTVTGESEASLGFEYVMLNDLADNGVQTRVDVYRPDGTRVAGSTVFTIPMRRDHHTLLRGAFLAGSSDGGVGIDPGFNDDHNIVWHP